LFFLSELDRKKLINQILPKARDVGVSDELRGWNWHKAPLKPYYDDVRIPMYSVCSKYCPTGRDVFLNLVKKVKGDRTGNVILGSAIHETVRTALRSYMDDAPLQFNEWYERVMNEKGVSGRIEDVKLRSGAAWRFTRVMCESRFMEGVSRQPYAARRDVMATALPFLVEHRISGELLGLSGLLSVDCYDYMRGIVFDMKVSEESRDWYQLQPTGYALVLESVYEIPINVGCTIYVRFRGDSLSVVSDLFFINDDLRSWWTEERDGKLQMVAQKKDPGSPNVCYETCMYRNECGVDETPRG
jgi:CRISPR-associated protein Csa1